MHDSQCDLYSGNYTFFLKGGQIWGEGGDLHSGATYILANIVSATLIYSGTTGQKVKVGTSEIGKYFRAP